MSAMGTLGANEDALATRRTRFEAALRHHAFWSIFLLEPYSLPLLLRFDETAFNHGEPAYLRVAEVADQPDGAVHQYDPSLRAVFQVSHCRRHLPRLYADSRLIRWRKSVEDEWSCALHGRILSLRQDKDYLHYRAIFPATAVPLPTPPSSSPAPSLDENSGDPAEHDTTALVKHYFNLEPNLQKLYEQWATADTNFKKKAPQFTGVRILRQDAWEALVGFICSSNNNIVRISQMVEKLCVHYGPLIGHIGSQPYHDFPQPAALTGPGVEQHLRQLGFGYRAKYLHQTAVMVAEEREEGWLDGLRNPESPVFGMEAQPADEMVEGGREGYRNAHTQLLELQGVGPKVADCVCLMGLGWGEAVPVDTHGEIPNRRESRHVTDQGSLVWQIAQRDYKFGKGKHSSLTKATYDAVGNRFRSLWGKEAGWAHSVLFTADLKAFSERLVAAIKTESEIDAVKAEENGKIKIEEEEVETVAIAKVGIKREHETEDVTVEVQKSTVKRRKRRGGK